MKFAVACTLALLSVAACGGSADEAAPATTTAPFTPTEARTVAVEVPTMPAVGEARLVLADGTEATLTVSTCVLGGESGDPQAALLADVRATDGERVLDIKRFRSEGASPTITDTITYLEGDEAAPDRVLAAQRFEVDGLVTDGRDPDATSPLLVIGAATLSGSGVFAPPGNFVEDGGLVAGAVAVHCG